MEPAGAGVASDSRMEALKQSQTFAKPSRRLPAGSAAARSPRLEVAVHDA
jgi:hypothetical protein